MIIKKDVKSYQDFNRYRMGIELTSEQKIK